MRLERDAAKQDARAKPTDGAVNSSARLPKPSSRSRHQINLRQLDPEDVDPRNQSKHFRRHGLWWFPRPQRCRIQPVRGDEQRRPSTGSFQGFERNHSREGPVRGDQESERKTTEIRSSTKFLFLTRAASTGTPRQLRRERRHHVGGLLTGKKDQFCRQAAVAISKSFRRHQQSASSSSWPD
jgi:hypothetical protein